MKRFVLFLAIVTAAALVAIGIHSLALPHHQPAPAGGSSQASPSPATSSPSPSASAAFDKSAYSLSDPASIWVVVNKQRPLNPKTFAPGDLAPVGNGQFMRAEAAKALLAMFAAAKQAGLTLTADSAYRSYDTQVSVYASEVRAYGQARADSESARPGYSEHQTGWAADIGSGGCDIADCFANTLGGKWAYANAYKYGFILRYPADKTAVTGYRAEAWHFRYVGPALAGEMHRQGIETLEEFFGLPAAPNY